MSRSTVLILVAAALGLPAWFTDVNSLPENVKAAWLAIMITIAIAGGVLWAKDRK